MSLNSGRIGCAASAGAAPGVRPSSPACSNYRVSHGGNEFANDQSRINGIESFWSFSKRRLQKFNGVPAATFFPHLKECERRFNHGRDNLYLELLRLLRHYPL